ncbi:hypothetical protein [Methylobacterium trifolii]|uniref:NTP pyrophosphohydrolase MazG putative catalytic core domain-containing protein n=1 Tax=Methylobacterium trifolii TaxID=1003092 RepID=A0ABQ4U2G0_9HYPH|nr:hypothetical protein [Methylobacterium trifolii]GJE61678.1 hypothetical protein MPOCJGCO_3801 [Methylobacterium trifolii]
MDLADLVRAAAEKARRLAEGYPRSGLRDDLPWKIIEAFDADVRGHVERDRQIENERDRVLIAAVKLADVRPDDEAAVVDEARRELVDAVDYLEQAVLRFGVVNRTAGARGLGVAGGRVSTDR